MSSIHQTFSVRVWDLPTRLFHWLLVLSFALLWLTQNDDRYLDLHVFAGYLFMGLLFFRIVWGFVGSRHARFSDFFYGLPSVWRYVRSLFASQRQHFIGHNPAGSWAIFLILGLGFVSSFSGLLTLGGEENHGPLAGLFTFAQGEKFRGVHEITAWLLLAVVIVHIIGVSMMSVLNRENLPRSMVTGMKLSDDANLSSVSLHILVAIILLSVTTGATGWYFYGYFVQSKEHPYLPFVGPQLPQSAQWDAKCGECHLAYHPTLLPTRSWKALLAGQNDHFGEDLGFAPEEINILQTFATQNASETALTEPAWKINRSIPSVDVPQRITETKYWLRKHHEIAEEIWDYPSVKGRLNCPACHLDAKEGTFEDGAMFIPDPQLN